MASRKLDVPFLGPGAVFLGPNHPVFFHSSNPVCAEALKAPPPRSCLSRSGTTANIGHPMPPTWRTQHLAQADAMCIHVNESLSDRRLSVRRMSAKRA